MFTTAVVSKLTSLFPGLTVAEAAEGEDHPTEKMEAQEEAYSDFYSTIFKTLLCDIDDRRGLEHGITFSAETDSRDTCFSQRVETPLEELYGCDPGSQIRQMRKLGQEYLDSYEGFDDSGDDGALHNLIRRIIWGQETDEDQLEQALRNINYRMQQMSVADRYVEAMAIPPPLGQQCHEWDCYHHYYEERSGSDERYAIKRMIFDDYEVLFPSPVEEQGRPFYKGVDYVVAALQHANLSMSEIRAKLKELEKLVDAEVENLMQSVMKDPEIVSKRQKLFGLYGKVLRSVSPSKRRSRGLSLTGSA